MKRMLTVVLTVLAVLAFAGVASAHVTVWPKESSVDAYERYTVRVPTEKDIPTTKVRVVLPSGTTFSGVLPLPGWRFDTEKDASGNLTALVWSGGQIQKGEFMEFGVSVKNPKNTGKFAWKAYQTYSDGSVVEWAGASDAKEPAPVVTLTAGPASGAGGDGHGDTAPAPAPAPADHPAPAVTAPAPAASSSNGGMWLGGAALLVSLVALLLALKKR